MIILNKHCTVGGSCDFAVFFTPFFHLSGSKKQKNWGEWPSGLKQWGGNLKVPGSNHTRCLAKRRGTLPGYKLARNLQVKIVVKKVINIGLVRLSPKEWSKVGCGSAKQQLKKVIKKASLDNIILKLLVSLDKYSWRWIKKDKQEDSKLSTLWNTNFYIPKYR